MSRTHVIIIVIVLALAVGVVVFMKPGRASAAGGAPATNPGGLDSGYAGDAAGEEYYGETPAPPEAPPPVKPSFLSTDLGKKIALAAVAPPVLATQLTVSGAKTVASAGVKLFKKIF